MPDQSNSSIAPRPEARELLATAIECLIALLDLQEPDPELEPNGDEEPSLGWTADGRGMNDDRELDKADDEPSLGATLATNQDRAWGAASGTRDDREEQCEDEGAQDDREPDVDAEADSWPNPMGPEVGARP
jgi:hypothetical protein